MIRIILAASIILLAFIVVPGLGGVRSRSRWRQFRDRMMRSTLLPWADFQSTTGQGPLGAHRFIGRFEALQDGDVLWLDGDGVTLRASMAESEIYVLPESGDYTLDARTLLEERFPEECPQPLVWSRMTPFHEGAKAYVVGFLESRDGTLRLYGSKDVPLLMILHEGGDVVPRAVWSGRPRNGYWNSLTPWSLLAGSLALFIMAAAVLRTQHDSLMARALLTAAFFPVMPLLPPGLILFFAYLANWRRARFLRAERDILGLSAFLRAGDAEEALKGWGDGLPKNTVPLIQACGRKALLAEAGALGAFLVGFIINVILTMAALDLVT